MGVVKNQKSKNKTKPDAKKDIANGKPKKDEAKVKKKKKVSCLQCFKSPDDGGLEGKYRVAAPELMQDTFMSDSEDEGGEVECPIQQQQQYRYMNSEAGTLQRARPLEDSVTDGHLWPSNNDSKVATIDRQPLDIGFLVSFVVDARGGAMKAKRRGGVRIVVPPAAAAAPTRVTCRAATRRAPAAAPPPLMEGEALASRLLELQPQGAKFLAPVIIEVPIFTAPCPEREIVILRSDTGETWQDHYLHNNDNPMIQEALSRERQQYGTGECVGERGERVTRIVTCDFPHYLAVVSRVRQEVHVIGPDGGTISSAHIPQVQAQFPAQALTKRIRVGLQAHGAGAARSRRVLPRHAAVSPVLTVEPRRRKFHRSITLTVPLPVNNAQGTGFDKSSTANLRLLCSIMGGQARAVWEDVTGSTPLTLTDDCASFTTTVSARFWLMNCQNVSDATKLATELYSLKGVAAGTHKIHEATNLALKSSNVLMTNCEQNDGSVYSREMLLVPFEVRIVVLGKRLDALEGRLLVMYITDRYAYDTLLQQEHYSEVAHSTAVRLLDGKPVYLEFSGNLVPVTKSAAQPSLAYESFKDNRLEFTVRVKHHEESPSGRIYFMNEPKVGKGEQRESPACVLDVELPAGVAPRAAKSQLDCLNLDQSGFDALKDELSFHWGDHNSTGQGSLPRPHIPTAQVNGHDKTIANGDVKYTENGKDEKDSTPQVNGGTIHVDSNKTKATFDSDEDKTPMNTLEKGKKKPEGGGSFLGGLGDKVKNLFGHSEDKDEDVKESSPKPQPKPRESKDKSPPKPAPRIINEDLLDKVEDMFKDLHSKPHTKEEDDINSKVYSTKLIVDEEDKPHTLTKIAETEYLKYLHMQPVDTPLHNKISDPFQFCVSCCEGRFKEGEKHNHDEPSNLTDRIDQVKFAAHEKLQDISERAQNDTKDGLDKLEKEKDNIKQKSNEVIEELIEKSEKAVQDLKDKKESLKSDANEKVENAEDAVNNKLDGLKKSAQKAQDDANAVAKDLKSKVSDGVDQLAHSAERAKDSAANQIHELDFAAREKAEELKLRGHDTLLEFEGALGSAANNMKHTAQDAHSEFKDGVHVVGETIHNVKDDLSHKAQDVKAGVHDKINNVKDATNEKLHSVQEDLSQKSQEIKDTAKDKLHNIQDGINHKTGEVKAGIGKNVENLKEATNEKVHEVTETIENVKEKGKKKSKEGKNFFTGLVHNIFGEKEKIENEVKDKVAETKESANELLQQASDTKDNLKDSVEKKHEELKEGAEQLAQTVHDKKSEVVDAVSHKKDQLESAINKKSDEAKHAVQGAKQEVEQAVDGAKQEVAKSVQIKLDEAKQAKDAVQSAAESELDRIRQEAEHTADEIKRTAEEKLNAATNKKAQIQGEITGKFEEITESGKDKLLEMQHAAEEKAGDLQRSSKRAFDHAQDSTLSAFDQLESSAKDTVSDMHALRDTLSASSQDAQDTLRSLHSSAGDTFDSLDESARDLATSTQSASTELFGDVQNTFEGFQLSAGNTLEDVKGSSKQKWDETGDRLAEVGDNVKESVKETEAVVLDKVATEADKFTSSLNDLGNSVFGSSGKGFMKDSSTKLLESEKAQSSPHKKSSGIPKLKRKK